MSLDNEGVTTMMLLATLRRAADEPAAGGSRSGCSLGWEDSREGVSSNIHTQDKRKEDFRLRVRYDITMVTMGYRRAQPRSCPRGTGVGGRVYTFDGWCLPTWLAARRREEAAVIGIRRSGLPRESDAPEEEPDTRTRRVGATATARRKLYNHRQWWWWC